MDFLRRNEFKEYFSTVETKGKQVSAGVILLMTHKNKHYVVLGYEKVKWSSFAGKWENDRDTSLSHCAARELVEETCGCLRSPFNCIASVDEILNDPNDERVAGAIVRNFYYKDTCYFHISFVLVLDMDKSLPFRFMATITCLQNDELPGHQAIREDGAINLAYLEKNKLGIWNILDFKKIKRKISLNFQQVLPVLHQIVAEPDQGAHDFPYS